MIHMPDSAHFRETSDSINPGDSKKLVLGKLAEMKRVSKSITLTLIVLLMPLATWAPAAAQEGGQVQELTGKVDQDKFQLYLLPDLKQGQILYVYASGTSGNLDPIAGLIDTNLDFQTAVAEYDAALERIIAQGRDPLLATEGLRDRFLIVWDDDSGGGLAAAFQFRVPRDGDYRLALTGSLSYQAEGTFGRYRLLLGLDAPEVLTGEAEPTGDVIAVPDERATQIDVGVERLTGSLSAEKNTTFVNLRDFEPDDTLYAFIEATSGDLKPVLVLRNFARKPIRTANLDEAQAQTSLEYTFPGVGENYQLEILGSVGDRPPTSGEYRLLIGRNAPHVLSGEAVPIGEPVVKEPIEVRIGIKLQQIIDVNQPQENFDVVASMQMDWTDPALAFNPDDCDCSVKLYTEEEFETFLADVQGRWPAFTIANQQGNRWTQNRIAVLYPDGSGTYFERFTTNMQLDFDFRRFPFDTQEFIIRVDLLLPEEFYQFSDLEGFNEISSEHGEDEFIITNFDTSISSVKGSTQDLNSRFTFSFEAPRHVEYYVLQVFLPIILIISVSWFTFFLKDYNRRIEVAAGNLLLFIAFSFSLADNYPRLGYLTLLDVIMTVTFVVTVLVVLYNVWLKRMEMKGEGERADRIDSYLDWIYPLAYIIPLGIAVWIFF
jgi:hypothetical protein